MRSVILLISLAFSGFSWAGEDCRSEVREVAYKAHGGAGGTTIIGEIRPTDVFLKPGEDKPYKKGEVWHPADADYDVQVYEVDVVVYGMSFIYAYTVKPDDCRVYLITEVYFE